ncbi:nucleoside diphosphate kinase [Tanacetum coccineum]
MTSNHWIAGALAVPAAGYKLVAIKLVVPSKSFVGKHYNDLKQRPFFNGLFNFLSSGHVLAMVWEGEGVITYGHKLIGATDRQKSEPGTIRGNLAIVVGRYEHHPWIGSDGPETAKNEINLWFKPEELRSYSRDKEYCCLAVDVLRVKDVKGSSIINNRFMKIIGLKKSSKHGKVEVSEVNCEKHKRIKASPYNLVDEDNDKAGEPMV